MAATTVIVAPIGTPFTNVSRRKFGLASTKRLKNEVRSMVVKTLGETIKLSPWYIDVARASMGISIGGREQWCWWSSVLPPAANYPLGFTTRSAETLLCLIPSPASLACGSPPPSRHPCERGRLLPLDGQVKGPLGYRPRSTTRNALRSSIMSILLLSFLIWYISFCDCAAS